MHILVATDAQYVVDEVVAALGGPETRFTLVSDGRAVVPAVKQSTPDIAVVDLQIGSMGGMAITMALRLDETSGAVPRVNVLMLLDRPADIHLANRSGADGYLVKPLSPLKLRRAVRDIVDPPAPVDSVDSVDTPDPAPDLAESIEATAG